jgi:hypothetical protein
LEKFVKPEKYGIFPRRNRDLSRPRRARTRAATTSDPLPRISRNRTIGYDKKGSNGHPKRTFAC